MLTNDQKIEPVGKPYSVATLAAQWACSTTFVYGLVESGELPAFRLGGKLIRINRHAVEEYEARSAVAFEAPTVTMPDNSYNVARLIRQRA